MILQDLVRSRLEIERSIVIVLKRFVSFFLRVFSVHPGHDLTWSFFLLLPATDVAQIRGHIVIVRSSTPLTLFYYGTRLARILIPKRDTHFLPSSGSRRTTTLSLRTLLLGALDSSTWCRSRNSNAVLVRRVELSTSTL